MRKRIWFTLVAMAMIPAVLCGCTAKLTTVRPAEISEMRVERMADGEMVVLPTTENSADFMDTLIFQLEEPYNQIANCMETDGHLYRVRLYIVEKLDTEVIINEDGSVCKGGKRHTPSDKADAPVNVADWNSLFDKADASEEPDPPLEASTPAEASTEAAVPAFVEENMEIVTAQGNAKQLPLGAEMIDSVFVCEIQPWSYYISNVRCEGQAFVMLWRDTPKGDDAQWVCRVAQTGGDTALRHSMEYVEGSYERSGETYLYFTVTDAASFHRSLWRFDPETIDFSRVLDAPCSNMILLEHEPHEAQGVGWIVHDHYLAAVNLTLGSADAGLTIDLDEYIDDSLFYGIGAFGTHKFAALSELGNDALQIDSITAEPETSAPELRTAYQFDILTHKFSQIAK